MFRFLIVLVSSLWLSVSIAADNFFVSTKGSDQNNHGSYSQPWKTIQHAIENSTPRSTIHVLPGTYSEKEILFDFRDSGKTLIGHGEVIISTNNVDYHSQDKNPWESYLPPNYQGQTIYRSTDALNDTQTGSDPVIAFGYFTYRGRNYKLVPYASWEAFTSPSDRQYGYIGPGTYYDRNGDYGPARRLYLRFDTTTQMRDKAVGFAGFAPDPNNLAIHLTVNPPTINIRKCDHVTVDGLTIENGRVLMTGTFGDDRQPDDATLRNIKLIGLATSFNKRGININKLADRAVLDNVYVTDNLPEWITWRDVKIFARPSRDDERYVLQNGGIDNGGASGFVVRNSVIRNIHDGVNISVSTKLDSPAEPGWNPADPRSDWVLHHNIFENIQDDGIQLGVGIIHAEIHHNAFMDVGSSVSKSVTSNHEINDLPGHKYLHHNLIDTRKMRFWTRLSPDGAGEYINPLNQRVEEVDATGRRALSPFSQHAFADAGPSKDPRMIFNNTVLSATTICAGRYGAAVSGLCTPELVALNQCSVSVPQQVMNNIFQVTVPRGFAAYMEQANDLSAPGPGHTTLYDGNVYHFEGEQKDPDSLFHPHMLVNMPDMADLHDLRVESQMTWEVRGMQENPLFDAGFVPRNPMLESAGADITHQAWPGVEDTGYVGAFDPRTGNDVLIHQPGLENAGFERPVNVLNGWSVKKNRGAVRIGQDTKYTQGERSSRASLLIERNDASAASSVSSSRWMPVLRGQQYSLRAFVRANGVGDISGKGPVIQLQYRNEAGHIVANYPSSFINKANFEWTEITASGISPADAVELRVRMILYGSGKAWFDNLHLTQRPNLVSNSSFEHDLTPDFVFRAGVVNQDHDVAFVGSSSMRIDSTEIDGHKALKTAQNRLRVAGGKPVKVSVFTRYRNVQGNSRSGVSVKIRYFDDQGNTVGQSSSQSLTGTNERWTKLTETDVAPLSAVSAEVVMRLRGAGVAWFDQLRVVQDTAS